MKRRASPKHEGAAEAGCGPGCAHPEHRHPGSTDSPGKETFSIDAILALLKSRGQRVTSGRRAILEVLFAGERPLSLNEITERCAAICDPPPDFATIFRTLTLLESLRIASKVNLQKARSYYELHDPRRHYDHLICTRCGRVLVLDMPCPVREAEEFIKKNHGFRSLSHSLEFFGICPECGRAGETQYPD